MEWGCEREVQRDGKYVYLWLIHVVWQKPTQCCKAIILQLKKKKRMLPEERGVRECCLGWGKHQAHSTTLTGRQTFSQCN